MSGHLPGTDATPAPTGEDGHCDFRFAVASPERRRRTTPPRGLKRHVATRQMRESIVAPPGVPVCVDAVTRFA
jgi:hypothetical protein